MKKLYSFLLLGLLVIRGYSQAVTTDPSLPTDNQPVAVYFHADKGNQGLINYSGSDVYAHTGVITDKSTSSGDWKYVRAEWTVNKPECKMTKLSANEYQLDIPGSIRSFYGVPEGEKILKLAFVFRNGTGSITGRETGNADIFSNVYEEGINVSIITPSDRFSIIGEDSTLAFSASATGSDSLIIMLDGIRIYKTVELSFDSLFTINDHARHSIIAKAIKADQVAVDTAWFMIPGITTQQSLPPAIEDGINYVSGDSVIFALYAPNKQHIYLLGDFNDWLPDSIYQLKQDGSRFWIALGGLTPGKEYAFQYLVDGQLHIADPYSEKILDPDNDKYIPASVYPDLISYPAFKTHDIAGVIQPGRTDFSWSDESYIAPQTNKLVIYELLIRDFVSSHSIKDVAAKLDYLQTLGVNAVELMPFSEFEGNNSWGYNPSFYFATDKYYGKDTDFKAFIDECHNRGMAVIMDMVLNHAYGSNPMVRLYYNASTGKVTDENPWFNVNSPNPVYSWGFDFNHESAATRYFVNRVVRYWLTNYHLDGFRFDFTKGFTNMPGDGSSYDASRIANLERIYDTIQTVKPGAYMICEHFAPNNEEKELSDHGLMLWGNSNYNFNEATMGYLENSDLSWASYKTRGWTNPNLVTYMESHDEERLMFKNLTFGSVTPAYSVKDLKTALEREELAGIFFFGIPGPKMIWQFGELGYDISIDFNGRLGEKPIKWDYYDQPDRRKLYLTWAKMLDFRKNYPVFSTDDYTMDAGNNLATKKIILRHEDGDALVIGNFGLTEAGIQPGFTGTGWWYELFSGDSINVSDVNSGVSLAAGEYRIYASRKMESSITGVNEHQAEKLGIYPNPAMDFIYLDIQEDASVKIFDVSGQLVLFPLLRSSEGYIDISSLKPGLYIINAEINQSRKIGRFVKQ